MILFPFWQVISLYFNTWLPLLDNRAWEVQGGSKRTMTIGIKHWRTLCNIGRIDFWLGFRVRILHDRTLFQRLSAIKLVYKLLLCKDVKQTKLWNTCAAVFYQRYHLIFIVTCKAIFFLLFFPFNYRKMSTFIIRFLLAVATTRWWITLTCWKTSVGSSTVSINQTDIIRRMKKNLTVFCFVSSVSKKIFFFVYSYAINYRSSRVCEIL